jgi:flagellar biosynthesis protein FlhB
MSDKTERATTYQLKKAKEQGKVCKSTEWSSSLFLLVMLCVITLFWPKILAQLQILFCQLIHMSTRSTLSLEHINHLHQLLLKQILNLWLPLALTGMITIILLSLLQTGFVWSTAPIIPDIKRLNIASGMKKLCSSKTLFDAVKQIIKLVGVTFLLYAVFKKQIPVFLSRGLITPNHNLSFITHCIIQTLIQLSVLLCVLSCMDLIFTRWKYAKENRMSKQEVKDEYKQREGDPKIKAKIKQLQNKFRQSSASFKQIKSADVIITNPTHFAVALKYECGVMPAPKVICKAQGEMACHVKSQALQYGIPVIENKPFARALFQTIDLNQWITPNLFPIAASIFRNLYAKKAIAP